MKSVYEEARDCLEEIIPLLEASFTVQQGHWCGGPNANCDMTCVENAHISETLSNVRRVQGKLDTIIRHRSAPSEDLEVPHQKVDAYARSPASEMPNY